MYTTGYGLWVIILWYRWIEINGQAGGVVLVDRVTRMRRNGGLCTTVEINVKHYCTYDEAKYMTKKTTNDHGVTTFVTLFC